MHIEHNVHKYKLKLCKDAHEEMARVADIIESQGFTYWLACGTLLGLYRDGKLLEGDTDIDFEILVNGRELPDLSDIGHVVRKVGRSKDDHMFQLCFQANTLIDIYFYRPHPKGIETWSESCGYVGYPHRFVENMQTIEYRGRQYPCFPPEEYCEYMFGKTWNTPRPGEPANWRGWSLE